MVARVFLAALALAAAAFGDEVRLRSEVDQNPIGDHDQVQLSVTLEGSSFSLSEEVAIPALKNLRAVGGPFLQTQTTIVNGTVTQARVYTWVLEPIAVGPAEVGPVHARLVSGERVAPAIALDVVRGALRAKATPPPDPFAGFFGGGDPFESLMGGRRRRSAEPKVAVRASLDRTRVRIGESVLLTYFVDTQVTITDLQFADPPQLAGFWSEDLPRPKATQGQQVTVDGETFHRFAVVQKLLYPTRVGRLEIPAARLRIGLERESAFDSGGVERKTLPLVVEAEAIPDGFSGAVGEFRATASLDRLSVALGEAVTLRFAVEGKGNLKWIDKGPGVKVNGAKVYPPQIKSSFAATPEGIRGSRTWEYVIVPETSGRLEVPSLSFDYFDPKAAHVVEDKTPTLSFEAVGATASAPVVSKVEPGTPALRSDLEIPRARLPEVGAWPLALCLCGAGLLHLALSTGVALPLSRGAGGTRAGAHRVQSALAELSRAESDGLSKEAAAALIDKALRGVFGDIDEGPPAGGDDDGDAKTAREILEEVKFIRYAPQLGDYKDKIRKAAHRSADLVRRSG